MNFEYSLLDLGLNGDGFEFGRHIDFEDFEILGKCRDIVFVAGRHNHGVSGLHVEFAQAFKLRVHPPIKDVNELDIELVVMPAGAGAPPELGPDRQ